MEPLQQIKIGDRLVWLVEGHTLSEGAVFEVFDRGQWVRVKHVQGELLREENDQMFFAEYLLGKPARLL